MWTSLDAKNLLDILNAQSALLNGIIDSQKKIHEAVIAKNWEHLQVDLASLDSLSLKFACLENDRISLCGSDASSFMDIIEQFPEQDRAVLVSAWTQLRQKLFASKIENRGLSDYLKITRDFLQGVFDSAVPNRKSKVYSNTGAIVNTDPESLVLNALM